MNKWKLLDISFSGLEGYDLHNYINFRNIPHQHIIGHYSNLDADSSLLIQIIDFCLSSPKRVPLWAYSSRPLHRFIFKGRHCLTIQKADRFYRIRKTLFVGPKERIKIITIFYEMVETTTGTEIIPLNGKNEAATNKKIRKAFYGVGMSKYQMTSFMYRGLRHNGLELNSESELLEIYSIAPILSHRADNIHWLIRNAGFTTQAEVKAKIFEISNKINGDLATLAGQLDCQVPYLEITWEPMRYFLGSSIKINLIDQPKCGTCFRSNLAIDAVLMANIAQSMDRLRPDFFTVTVSNNWSWLTCLQVNVILDYLLQFVDQLIMIFDDEMVTIDGHQNDKIKTTDGRPINDLVNVFPLTARESREQIEIH